MLLVPRGITIDKISTEDIRRLGYKYVGPPSGNVTDNRLQGNKESSKSTGDKLEKYKVREDKTPNWKRAVEGFWDM